MSYFEQCSNRLQLDLISLFGIFSVARKRIVNGGAIWPTDLLLLTHPSISNIYIYIYIYIYIN